MRKFKLISDAYFAGDFTLKENREYDENHYSVGYRAKVKELAKFRPDYWQEIFYKTKKTISTTFEYTFQFGDREVVFQVLSNGTENIEYWRVSDCDISEDEMVIVTKTFQDEFGKK